MREARTRFTYGGDSRICVVAIFGPFGLVRLGSPRVAQDKCVIKGCGERGEFAGKFGGFGGEIKNQKADSRNTKQAARRPGFAVRVLWPGYG
jgi:hypothetical protein